MKLGPALIGDGLPLTGDPIRLFVHPLFVKFSDTLDPSRIEGAQ
jgi:hypothetical protein